MLEQERPSERGKRPAEAGRCAHIWRVGLGRPLSLFSPSQEVLEKAWLEPKHELPRSHGILAGQRVPSQASGGSGKPGVPCPPAETAGLPRRLHAGKPALPPWVAPRQQGVNLLSVGKASRTLLPACVCSGLGASETETGRTPGPASPHGILPGFTFYGEDQRAGRSRVWSLGRACGCGRPGSLRPPPQELPPPTPPPPPGTRSKAPEKHMGRRARVA